MKQQSSWRKKTMTRRTRGGNRNLRSIREAVAGLLELRKQIFERNKGKPRLTIAEVKSWIKEGRLN